MKKISATLFTATVAILCMAGAAGAETYSKIVRQNCRVDYKPYCGEYGLESAALQSCMDRNGKNLSKGCVNALVQSGEVMSRCRTERNRSRAVVGVSADTGNDDSVRSAVTEAVRLLGGSIDILVNAAAETAGFAAPPQLADITGEFFHAEMNVKVMGYLRCAQAVAPQMIERGWGRIVNISGLAARSTGSIIGSVRNVSVAAPTKNLADEPGPRPGAFERSSSTCGKGLGLGLSLCAWLAMGMGGRLMAEANTPRGALFRLSLPKAPA